jgi:hypothetical protein
MAELEKLIRITVDSESSIVKINELEVSINDVTKAQNALNDTFIKTGKSFERNEAAIQNQIRTLKTERANLAQTTIQYGQFTSKIKELELELKVLQGTAVRTADGVTQLRNSSGLASQTLVEVGRTISDANYGFTAVANNLSQLSYYFIALVKDSKGVTGAFKDLGRQLLGAGGIVIAIQLVITLIERYALKQREAQRATKDLTNALVDKRGQIAAIESYAKVLKDSTASAESQRFALEKLKKEGFDKLIGSVDEYIAVKKELLLFEATEEATKKQLQAVIEKDIELNQKLTAETTAYTDTLNEISDLEERQQKSYVNKNKLNENYTETWVTLTNEINKNNEAFGNITLDSEKRLKELADKFKNNPFFDFLTGKDDSKQAADKRLAVFKRNLLDLSSEIEKYRQQSLQDNSLNAEGLLEQDRAFAIAELQIKKERFAQEESLRKDNYIKQLDEKKTQAQKDNKWTEEDEENYRRLILESDETLKNELLAAEALFNDAMLMLNQAFNTELQNIKDEQQSADVEGFIRTRRAITSFQREGQISDARTEVERLELREKFRQEDLVGERMKLQNELAERKANGEAYSEIQEELNRLDIENTRKTEEAKIAIRKAALTQIADNIDKAKEYVQALADFIDADFEAQSQKEENKTNAINNELRARLANENLSKEEKEKINQQIAANEEKLRLKQEEIDRKRFKTDKAFRISMALMDTASAALKAYVSQLSFDPSSPIRAALAAAAATALGLAQVAMISKQQFQSSASSTPPSVGGGTTAGTETPVQAPDFNVVGQSNVSQLAQIVQAQLDKPFKTYVVAKDVTTAQELDRNRVSAATI